MSDVGLVMGSSGVPSTGDTNIKNVLTGMGLSVTNVDDGDAYPGAGTHRSYFITESGSPTTLGTKYVGIAEPIACVEVGYMDGLKISSVAFANEGSGTTWDPIGSHQIIQGLADPLTIYTSSTGRYGTPKTNICAGGVLLVQHPTDTLAACAVAVDTGAALTTGNAVNRIVGWGLHDSGAAVLAAGMQSFIQNVITWLLPPVAGFQGWGVPVR